MFSISKYLDPKLVVISLQATDCEEILKKLVDLLYDAGKLPEKEPFYNAILEREKIVSTAIGMGVAIPHAKLPMYDDFFIAIATLKKEVDWGAFDSSPVRLVFMIGGPDDKPTEYLQILSTLTTIIKNEELRKKMLTLNSNEAIISLFKAQ